jgi:hypothetical protein
VLASKYQKRLFFGSAFLAFFSLIITRFFIIPYLSGKPIEGISGIINAILDNLLVALVTSISITLLLLWLTPQNAEAAVMEVVDSPRISEILQRGRDRATEYWYKGNTGRYFRSVTLPELAKEARLENATKNVFLIILDPRDNNACEYYALFRQRLRSAKKDKPWSGLRVQLELNSTIVSAYAWKAQEPALNITVALVDVVSLFRIDFSSRLTVITREDERQPALMCEANSLFYLSYREDLFVSLQQAKILPNNVMGVPLQYLDVTNTRQLVTDLGLDSQNLSDSAIDEIITLSKQAENPYA